MGVGQRVIRGAAHVGGVIVVRGSDRVRTVLEPVYAAMGVAWNPETTGSVDDEIGGATRDDVAAALLGGAARALRDRRRAASDARRQLEARFAIAAAERRSRARLRSRSSAS